MIKKSFYGIPYMIGALFIGFIGSLLADKVLIIQNMFICAALANVHYVMWRYFKYKSIFKEISLLMVVILSCTIAYGLIMLMTLSWLNVAEHNGFFNFNFSIFGLLAVLILFGVVEYLFAATKWMKKAFFAKMNVVSLLIVVAVSFIFASLALQNDQQISLAFINSAQSVTVYWYFLANSVVAFSATVALLTFKKPLNHNPMVNSSKVGMFFKVSITIIGWLSIPVLSYLLLQIVN